MLRRTLLAAGAAATLARPAIAQGAAGVLRFSPQGNLQNPDPVWTTTTIARNHALMIWDTLYGWDGTLTPQPQMVAGHEISDDARTWTMTLRDGLAFHDGEPVRAADCVASVLRYAKRRPLGQKLLELADEILAVDDRRLRFRLKAPFPLLTYTLCDWCFVMPERIARTDPFTQITEYVGSGPFRFVRDEWVSGSRAVYARNDAYRPRDGAPDFAAGGKVVHFDRVEWQIMPDKATEAGALRAGEIDWIEQPQSDLLPQLARARGVRVLRLDQVGVQGLLGINHLHAPFNDEAIRRAVLMTTDQNAYLEAAYGDASLYQAGCGVFTPSSPMANDAGLEAITGPRDIEAAKRLVAASPARSAPVVLLSPSDYPIQAAFAQVAREQLQAIGLTVDYVSTDWGTLVQRRASKEAPARGGWSMFPTTYEGLTVANPGSHVPLRGNGAGGWFGWPTDPAMETLRDAWFDADDLASQKGIAARMQRLAFEHVPYIPLGQGFQPIAVRDNLQDLVKASFPIFWGVRKA